MPIYRFIDLPVSGSRRPKFTTVIVGGIALLATGLGPARAATARAATDNAGCTGYQTVTYKPPLTNNLASVGIHGDSVLPTCLSSDGTIVGAKSSFDATGRFSCTSGTYAGTRTITWSNGRTSTLSFNSSVSANVSGQGIVAITGKVDSGEFSGQPWHGTFTMFASRPAACGLTGLPTLFGPLVLTIGPI